MVRDFIKRRDREFEAQLAQFLAVDSSSPYVWELPSAWVGKTIWYRGAWVTPRGARGA